MYFLYVYVRRRPKRKSVQCDYDTLVFLQQLNRLLLYFCLTGHIMALISSGRRGDQVLLTSILHEFAEPVALTLDYLLQEDKPGTGGSLSVYLLSKQRVPMLLHFDKWIADLEGGWQRGCVSIPKGTYQVMFLGTLGMPYRSDIYLDNVAFRQSWVCRHYQSDVKLLPTGNFILSSTK